MNAKTYFTIMILGGVSYALLYYYDAGLTEWVLFAGFFLIISIGAEISTSLRNANEQRQEIMCLLVELKDEVGMLESEVGDQGRFLRDDLKNHVSPLRDKG